MFTRKNIPIMPLPSMNNRQNLFGNKTRDLSPLVW